jgi:two-component system NtrC family response regulator
VRELQNLIRRALVTISGGWIAAADLGLADVRPETDEEPFTTLQAARERAERRCLRQALLLSGNNISQAAKLIETSRPTVHDLMKKHSITV